MERDRIQQDKKIGNRAATQGKKAKNKTNTKNKNNKNKKKPNLSQGHVRGITEPPVPPNKQGIDADSRQNVARDMFP